MDFPHFKISWMYRLHSILILKVWALSQSIIHPKIVTLLMKGFVHFTDLLLLENYIYVKWSTRTFSMKSCFRCSWWIQSVVHIPQQRRHRERVHSTTLGYLGVLRNNINDLRDLASYVSECFDRTRRAFWFRRDELWNHKLNQYFHP